MDTARPPAVQALLRGAAVMIVLLTVVLPALQANDVVTTVVTDADAHVKDLWGGERTYNFGGATSLLVQRTSGIRKTYLNFDLSSLDPRGTVTDARLKVRLASWSSSYGQTLMVSGFMKEDEDWDPATLPEGSGTGSDTVELDIVWDNAPLVGATGGFTDEGTGVGNRVRQLGSHSCVGNASIDLDVTDFILWACGDNPSYGNYTEDNNKITIGLHETSDIYCSFRSREYTAADDSDAPRLVITQSFPPAGTVFRIR